MVVSKDVWTKNFDRLYIKHLFLLLTCITMRKYLYGMYFV